MRAECALYLLTERERERGASCRYIIRTRSRLRTVDERARVSGFWMFRIWRRRRAPACDTSCFISHPLSLSFLLPSPLFGSFVFFSIPQARTSLAPSRNARDLPCIRKISPTARASLFSLLYSLSLLVFWLHLCLPRVHIKRTLLTLTFGFAFFSFSLSFSLKIVALTVFNSKTRSRFDFVFFLDKSNKSMRYNNVCEDQTWFLITGKFTQLAEREMNV